MVDAGRLYHEWPQPIPGQELSVNFEAGEVTVREPLWDAPHNAIRQKVEAKGMKLPPGSESTTVAPATAFYWLTNALESGDCKIIDGTMPTRVDGEVQTRFHSTAPVEPIDRLTAAIEKQTELMARLLTKLAEK